MMLKECKPLFGLVKHHVPAKFQIKANEESDEGSLMDLNRSISIDPFSSLPPSATTPLQRYYYFSFATRKNLTLKWPLWPWKSFQSEQQFIRSDVVNGSWAFFNAIKPIPTEAKARDRSVAVLVVIGQKVIKPSIRLDGRSSCSVGSFKCQKMPSE